MSASGERGNGFWRGLAFGMSTWALRRGAFILACGIIGALSGLVTGGADTVPNGFVIGLAVGLGLLVAWFALRELLT